MSESRDSQYSSSHDKHFFDTFMLVLGLLVAVAFALYVLARVVAANTQEQFVLNDPIHVQEAADRLSPVALLAVSGQDNSAVEAAMPAPATPAAPPAVMSGEQVYNTACVACHGGGIGGAPVFGNKAAWAPRIAKGVETLRQHSLQGFQGAAGLMPAKGGRVDLADESIINAVEYMVEAAR